MNLLDSSAIATTSALAEAVKRCKQAVHSRDWSTRETIFKDIVALCPHKLGAHVIANGAQFRGRPLKIERISADVASFPTGAEWYWRLDGHIVLKNGHLSLVNLAYRTEAFLVEKPYVPWYMQGPLPGDACL